MRFVLGLLCLSAGSGLAQVTPLPLDGIVSNAAAILLEHGTLALSVGVIRADEEHVASFGQLSPTDKTSPVPETYFGIGSISKAFTGMLLAEMVARGEVKLDQPIAELLDPTWTVPEHQSGPVTLKHLSSHTSGLPRLPFNNFPAPKPMDPYGHYDLAKLKRGVERIKFASPPGKTYAYSNFGAGLLGVGLARKADKDTYEELLLERILKPLGMNNTWVTPNEARRKQLAPGYNAPHEAQVLWNMPMFEAAGSLRSNVPDMMKLLRAEIRSEHPDDFPASLAKAFELSREPVQKISSGHICLGWHRARDGSTYWHNGETYGYHAYAGFNREYNLGVVVLATGNFQHIDAFGEYLVRTAASNGKKPFVIRADKDDVDISIETLDRYTGSYRLAPGSVFTITRQGKQLYAKLTGQQFMPVYPRSEVEFVYKAVEAKLLFDKEGKALSLFQNGRFMPAKRIAQVLNATRK